ncbi:MAG: ABC transporter permease [Planctomycetota bacterium]|nr:ABC transporter permease [Planctomycetota bacterium]
MSRPALIASWALQSFVFHRTRSLLAVLAVALATALVVSALAFQSGYERSLERNVDALGYQILVTGKGCPHEAATLILRGGSIPMYVRDEVYRHVVAQPEVKDATRFFMQSVPNEEEGSRQLYVGVDDDFLRLKPAVTFQRGAWFSSELADEAILGFNVAEYRRLGLGDGIEVQRRELTVVGVLDRQGTQDDGTIFLPLVVAQDLFERRDRLTGIGLRLHDMTKAAGFIERLYDVPSVQVVRMSQVQSAILNVLHGVRALLYAFGTLCLVVALTGVVNVALITLNERTGEMGVLRALGCPARTLFGLVWSESLLVSLGGVALGAVLTVALRGAVEAFVRGTLSFVPSGAVVEITPAVLLTGCGTVVALCLLAAVYPAWRSVRVSPATSLRGGAW